MQVKAPLPPTPPALYGRVSSIAREEVIDEGLLLDWLGLDEDEAALIGELQKLRNHVFGPKASSVVDRLYPEESAGDIRRVARWLKDSLDRRPPLGKERPAA